jgi:hypothetical protein
MGNLGFTKLTTAQTQGKPSLLPYSILCITLQHLRLNGILSQDSQRGVPKLSRFGLPGLYEFITLCLDLRLGWGLKQTCISPWELSNSVSHSTCTHWGGIDSRLLVVGSQTASLTPDLSFCHNLCYRCPNGSCETIFDIYTLIVFQWYEERFKARCFDPWNWALKFWESRRTPKSPFRECECHPHTLPKVGLRHMWFFQNINIFLCILNGNGELNGSFITTQKATIFLVCPQIYKVFEGLWS